MEDQRNNIDNFFRDGLGGYTETPPPAAWDALEKRLDERPKKRLPYQWMLFALVSSAIVMGVLVTNKTGNGTSSTENSTANMPVAAISAPGTGTEGSGTVTTGSTAAHHTGVATVMSATSNHTTAANPSGATTAPAKAMTATKSHTHSTQAARSNSNDVASSIKKMSATHDSHSVLADNNSIGKATVDTKAMNGEHTAANGHGPDADVVVASGATSGASQNANATVAANMTKADATATQTTNAVSPAVTNKVQKSKKHVGKNNTDVNTLSAAATVNKKANSENKNLAADANTNKIAVVASKQNNIKVTSEVPADVLAAKQEAAKQEQNAAQAQQSKTTGKAAVAVITKTANRPKETAPDKIAANDVRVLNTKSAFKETVTIINMPASANNGSGDMNGGGGSAADKKASRWEAGIKAGYETGTRGMMANKYDLAPYVKYNISKRASIIVQPGIKLASIKNTSIDSKYYYNLDTSNIASQRSQYSSTVDKITYKYLEQGDSFKVNHNVAQHNYMEVEIPIMFSYQASKNLQLLAGISMVYSKLMSVAKDSVASSYTTFNTFNSNAPTVNYFVPTGAPAPAAPGINSMIPHTASPYLTLANPAYQVVGGDVFSIGYLFGFSYNITKRFMFDGMVQQNLSSYSMIKNADIKNLYAQPYVRFTIGFKLTRPRD